MKGESSWGCVVCLQARSLVSTGEGKGKAPLPGDSLLYVPPSLGGPGSGSRKLLPLYSCLCSSSFFVPRIESLSVGGGRDTIFFFKSPILQKIVASGLVVPGVPGPLPLSIQIFLQTFPLPIFLDF